MTAPFPPGSSPGARATTGHIQPTDGGLFTGPVEAVHSVTWPRPSGTSSTTLALFDAAGTQTIAMSFLASSLLPSVQKVAIGITASQFFADNLVISLYSDAGGLPSVLIDSVTVPASQIDLGATPDQYFSLPSVNSLTPGARYWIVVHTTSGSNYVTNQFQIRGITNTSGSHPFPPDSDTLIGAGIGSLSTATVGGKPFLANFQPGSAGIASFNTTDGTGNIIGSGYDGDGYAGAWVGGGGSAASGPAAVTSIGTDLECAFVPASLAGNKVVLQPFGPSEIHGQGFTTVALGGSSAEGGAGFRAGRRSDGSWVFAYYDGAAPHSAFVQTWSTGGGFSTPLAFGTAGSINVAHAFFGENGLRILSLLIDDSDNAHIIWAETDTDALFHQVLTPGGALGSVGTWEGGLISAAELYSNVGVGCAFVGGITVPYLRNDGCFRMASWPANAAATTPAIRALPQTISPADVLIAGLNAFNGLAGAGYGGPGCLAAFENRLYCFHRVTSGQKIGVATFDSDSGLWTGSTTAWNNDVAAGAISAAYLPTKGLMGVLFNTYFQYWSEPGGGYPDMTDYNCMPKGRSYAFVFGV